MTSTLTVASDEVYPDTWTPPPVTAFPRLRTALDPTYADASDEEIETYVAATLPGVTAGDLEQVVDDLGRTLARIAPGALSGALTGLQAGTAAMPGWGSLIGAGVGALGGGLLSLLSPGGGSTGAPPPRRTPPRSTPTPPRPTPRPTPPPTADPRPTAPPAPAGTPSTAAAQLLALLSQPQVIQALTALALGPGGRRDIRVAGAQVPTTDVAEAVSRLAELAGGDGTEASA